MKDFIKPDKTMCFSGPRPVKYDYSDTRLKKINAILYSEITGLLDAGYDTLLFGGAPGFDLINLKVALKIKEETEHKNIRLICALPFEQFSKSQHFDDYWRKWYNDVTPYCEIINVGKSATYFQSCFRIRNFYMIDNSNTLICLYNGKPGGTGQTYAYGARKGRHIINIHGKVDGIIAEIRKDDNDD